MRKIILIVLLLSTIFLISCGVQSYKVGKEKFNEASLQLLMGNFDTSNNLLKEAIAEFDNSLSKIDTLKERIHIYIMKAKAEFLLKKLPDASRTIDLAEEELNDSLQQDKHKILSRDMLLLEVLKAEFYAYNAIWLSETTNDFSDSAITYYQEAISRYEKLIDEKEIQEDSDLYAIISESAALCYRGIAAEYGKRVDNEALELQKESLHKSSSILIKFMKKANVFRPLVTYILESNQKDLERLNKM